MCELFSFCEKHVAGLQQLQFSEKKIFEVDDNGQNICILLFCKWARHFAVSFLYQKCIKEFFLILSSSLEMCRFRRKLFKFLEVPNCRFSVNETVPHWILFL
jgi:hypothetical protein